MSETFRKFLRTLPDFPADLPGFDPDNAPQDPALLFKQWLDEALDAGSSSRTRSAWPRWARHPGAGSSRPRGC